MRGKQLVVFLGLLGMLLSQSIIDYSHTHELEKVTTQGQRYKVELHPDNWSSKNYEFPFACSLVESMEDKSLEQSEKGRFSDQQTYLKDLTFRMDELLRLSQKIRKLKNFTQELASELPQKPLQSPIEESELEKLLDLENQLKIANWSIEEKISNLSQFVQSEVSRAGEGSFDKIQFQFSHKSWLARLEYLKYLRNESQIDQQVQNRKINSFFRDIEFQISRQQEQFKSLLSLFNQYSQNSKLKLNISSLNSQIQAYNIMIREKEECRQHANSLSNKQHEILIAELTRNLRKYKKMEKENNVYCDGVAKKLERQLKKVLKVYNYSFACSEGLNDLSAKRTALLLITTQLTRRLSEIAYSNRSSNIDQYFNDSINNKIQKLKQTKSFQIEKYQRNKSQLESEIRLTQKKIQDLVYRLENPTSAGAAINYQKIRILVKEIKEQKYKYCQLRDLYEEKNRKIQYIVRAHEQRVKQRLQNHRRYLEELSELRTLERRFQQIREGLLRQFN